VKLSAPDNSFRWAAFLTSWTLSPSHIRSANFLPVGATTANLYVKDKHGKFRDVLLGYDNHVCDVPRMFFSASLTRGYVDELRDERARAQLLLTCCRPLREPHQELDVLRRRPNVPRLGERARRPRHSARWRGRLWFVQRPAAMLCVDPAFTDVRNWTVSAQSAHSVTFHLVDKAFEGFPGTVNTSVGLQTPPTSQRTYSSRHT
jgi:aldose 1-epimerase